MKLININNSNFITASPTRPSRPEVHQLTSTEKIVQEYADVFEREVGSLPGTVHLETEDNPSPVIIPPRWVPTALKTKLNEELDKYVKLGVLAQVEGLAASPSLPRSLAPYEYALTRSTSMQR